MDRKAAASSADTKGSVVMDYFHDQYRVRHAFSPSNNVKRHCRCGIMARSRMRSQDGKPERREIEKELERVIASNTFKTHPTLRKLLGRLVKDSMDGIEVSDYEYRLGIEIFDKRKGWVPQNETVVRQGVTNLRKRLDEYYKREGASDLVEISVPKRHLFKAKFSYNSRSPVLLRYQRSVELFGRTFLELTPDTAVIVVQDFEDAISKEAKSYAPAYSSLAEIILIYTLWEMPGFRPAERLPEIARLLRRCLALDNRDWLAVVVLGVLNCCLFDWERAAKVFEAALRISEEETRASIWHQAFLCAVGKADAALEQSAESLKAVPRSDSALARHALFLYLTRNFEVARGVAGLRSVDLLGKTNWLVELLMACIYYAEGHGDATQWHARNAHKSSTLSAGLQIIGEVKVARDDLLPARLDSAFEMAKLMERNPLHFGPVGRALGYIGLGLTEAAMRMLTHACDTGSPLMAWLHLLPIFDPLRDHEEFKALTARVRPRQA